VHLANDKGSFYGSAFDQARDWTNRIEEKARAVVEVSQPQSPYAVHGFLGLVGFSASFATTADPLRKVA